MYKRISIATLYNSRDPFTPSFNFDFPLGLCCSPCGPLANDFALDCTAVRLRPFGGASWREAVLACFV